MANFLYQGRIRAKTAATTRSQRLGGAGTLKADIRVVAATNRDPRRSLEAGEFREDLYYRLSVFEIHLPPLRERPEDILVLTEAFLGEIAKGVGRPAAGISADARDQLLAHTWPGNVQELRNAIERAVILCEGDLVTREHLPMTGGKAIARARCGSRPGSGGLSGRRRPSRHAGARASGEGARQGAQQHVQGREAAWAVARAVALAAAPAWA